MCYYMKLLKTSKTEIKAFIREFEKITDNYRQAVNKNVVAIVIHPDLATRMKILKNFFAKLAFFSYLLYSISINWGIHLRMYT